MDHVTLLYNKIAPFYDLCGKNSFQSEDFVVGFHFSFDKISKLIMHDELKRHLLLHQAMDSNDHNIIIGPSEGDNSIQELSTSMRNAFWTERLPRSSMNTCLLGHYRNQRHWKWATSQNHPRQLRTTTTTGEGSSLFYTFIVQMWPIMSRRLLLTLESLRQLKVGGLLTMWHMFSSLKGWRMRRLASQKVRSSVMRATQNDLSRSYVISVYLEEQGRASTLSY